jgi:carbon storage regulator
MLVLTLKPGQEVVIGDGIRLTVVAIHGSRVRLGISAPADMPILRLELCCPIGETPRLRAERLRLFRRARTPVPGAEAIRYTIESRKA